MDTIGNRPAEAVETVQLLLEMLPKVEREGTHTPFPASELQVGERGGHSSTSVRALTHNRCSKNNEWEVKARLEGKKERKHTGCI